MHNIIEFSKSYDYNDNHSHYRLFNIHLEDMMTMTYGCKKLAVYTLAIGATLAPYAAANSVRDEEEVFAINGFAIAAGVVALAQNIYFRAYEILKDEASLDEAQSGDPLLTMYIEDQKLEAPRSIKYWLGVGALNGADGYVSYFTTFNMINMLIDKIGYDKPLSILAYTFLVGDGVLALCGENGVTVDEIFGKGYLGAYNDEHPGFLTSLRVYGGAVAHALSHSLSLLTFLLQWDVPIEAAGVALPLIFGLNFIPTLMFEGNSKKDAQTLAQCYPRCVSFDKYIFALGTSLTHAFEAALPFFNIKDPIKRLATLSSVAICEGAVAFLSEGREVIEQFDQAYASLTNTDSNARN